MSQQNKGKHAGSGKNLCPMCRKPLKDNSFFCTICGHRIGDPPKAQIQTPKNPELLKYQRYQDPIPEAGAIPDSESKQNPLSVKTLIKEFLTHYLILIAATGVFMIAGLVLITIASVRKKTIEYPVQWDQRADAVYFSSTKLLAKYTPDGDLVWRLEKAGKDRPLSGRLDYTFGPDGNIYLANTDAQTIELISPDGDWLSTIGKGAFSSMFTFVFLKDGRLAVADTQGNSLLIYTIQNEQEAVLGGSAGVGVEQFNTPGGIAQLPNGLIHVVDSRNKRMQRIDLQNIFRETWDLGLPGIQAPERSGLIRSIRNSIFENEMVPVRSLFDPVRDHVHICYANTLEFPAPEAFIVRLDTQGQPVQTVQLLDPEGKPLNVQSLSPALDDNIAVVDPGAFKAGLWNPAENSFEPISNSGVNIELDRMSGGYHAMRTLRGIGIFLISLGFSGVAAAAFMIYSEHKDRKEKALAARRPKPPAEPPNLSQKNR